MSSSPLFLEPSPPPAPPPSPSLPFRGEGEEIRPFKNPRQNSTLQDARQHRNRGGSIKLIKRLTGL